jgi:hypothetical protein
MRKTPSRLTRVMRRHSAKSTSSHAVNGTIAALFTRMSDLAGARHDVRVQRGNRSVVAHISGDGEARLAKLGGQAGGRRR